MLVTTVVGGTANNSCEKGPYLQQLKTATEAIPAGRHTYYSAPRRASSSLIRGTSTDFWELTKALGQWKDVDYAPGPYCTPTVGALLDMTDQGSSRGQHCRRIWEHGICTLRRKTVIFHSEICRHTMGGQDSELLQYLGGHGYIS